MAFAPCLNVRVVASIAVDVGVGGDGDGSSGSASGAYVENKIDLSEMDELGVDDVKSNEHSVEYLGSIDPVL